MYRHSTRYTIVSVLLLAVVVWGCSDNGVNADSKPPQLPQLTKVRPDLSFFKNNNPSDTSSTQAFYDAKDYMVPVVFANLFLDAEIALIQAASDQNPVFESGMWVWTYTTTVDKTTAEVRLTAGVGDQATEWKLFASFDTETRPYEDALLLTGTVQNDHKSGNWAFRSPIEVDDSESIVKIIESEWTVTGEDQSKITLVVFDQGTEDGTFTFQVDGPEHAFTVVDSGDKPDATIVWNDNTSEGSITQGESIRCWNSSLQNAPCSETGV